MSKGKRSPTAHRTPEQITKHGRTYQARPEVKKRRAERNRIANKIGSNSSEDNAHSKPLARGGKAGDKTHKESKSKNRGHGLGRNGTKPDKATVAAGKNRVKKRVTGKG